MNRYHHSKSGLFLMELLMNLLLFCLLCGCGLTFFVKSHRLIEDATTLHRAVTLTTSVAGIYESGDGSFHSLCEAFEGADMVGNSLYLYFDEDYQPCQKETCTYFILAEYLSSSPDKIQIDFYNEKGEVAYSIRACHYSPGTLNTAKEESAP